MKKKFSKKEALEKINNFFERDDLDSKEIRKMIKLCMKFNIKLGKYRQKFCKKCFESLSNSIIRITKNYKMIKCSKCEYWNKIRIKPF
jgi:RNase P subunit RPR2